MTPVGASCAPLPCRGAKVFVIACSMDLMPFLPSLRLSKKVYWGDGCLCLSAEAALLQGS